MVLTGWDLAGATTLFRLGLVLTEAGAALAFTGGVGNTLAALLVALLAVLLATGLATDLATTLVAVWASFLSLATLWTAAVGLACAPFLLGAALADAVFTGAATFFFGVVTSCLLAV